MMILRSSPPSPFGRKVKIAAKMLGLYDQITVENSDTTDPQDSLRQQNPLGKIPVLIPQDGKPIYDSRVIIDYLDLIAGGAQLIAQNDLEERRTALTLQALADGMMDASILIVYETRMRSENERSQSWIDYQAEKVARALTYLENETPVLTHKVNVGDIALACALGYRDLRFGPDWRESHPNLANWLGAFADKVPAFAQTAFNPNN